MKNNRTNGGRQNALRLKLRVHPHLPIHVMPKNILRVVRYKVGRVSVLVQKSGLVDDDVQISALDPFYEMDVRVVKSEKCWNGIEEETMSEISREANQMNPDRQGGWLRTNWGMHRPTPVGPACILIGLV